MHTTVAFESALMIIFKLFQLLLKAVGSSDRKKQQAAAKCLTNIRKLALTADKIRTKQVKL